MRGIDIKELNGKTVEEVLAILTEMGIDFEYEAETENTIGGIIIGEFWGDHIEFDVENDIVCDGGEIYWE